MKNIGIIIGAVLVGATFNAPLDSTYVLTGEITPKTVESFTLLANSFNSFISQYGILTIDINSPGGYVASGQAILDRIKHTHKFVITETRSLAASEAAEIFLSGNMRLMGKDAGIVIHEARMMISLVDPKGPDANNPMYLGEQVAVTFSDLLSLLTVGTLAPNSKIEAKWVPILKTKLYLMIKENERPTIISQIKKEQEEAIKYIMERTGQTREIVTTKLLVSNIDTWLNQADALKYNVATRRLAD